MGRKIRIAFQHAASDSWAAGDLFLEVMVLGLRALGDDCPALVLITDERETQSTDLDLAAKVDEVITAPLPTDGGPDYHLSLRRHLGWWLRHRLLRVPVRPARHPLTEFLPAHRIDVYFTKVAASASVRSVSTVVWLPDFQHIHLPELFSPEDRASRDRQFRAQARAASRILVTSGAVKKDLAAYIPEAAAKARCIDFVAFVPPETYAEDPRPGLAAYHLPEKFIYLPNQFWQHKNHTLVLQALARLAARGVHPTIVSTGNPLDYRRPAYFSELMQLLSRANLREQFIILGQVPRADVFRLMRQAVCVLNPSRFEGLGMSVAESKSLGKRVLISDLGPLREQAAPGAVYFDPADVDDLAGKLETAWLSLAPGPDLELEGAARAALPGRQAQFGRALLQVFSEAQAAFQPARAGHD